VSGWHQLDAAAAAHGITRDVHTTCRICDIIYIPDYQNLRGLTPILTDISLIHPFVENAVHRKQWSTYLGKGLCQQAQMKLFKHVWAASNHIVVPFVSDTLGSMTGKSAVSLCLFAWCQALQETEFFVEDWGDGAGADTGNSALVDVSQRVLHRWDSRLTLAV